MKVSSSLVLVSILSLVYSTSAQPQLSNPDDIDVLFVFDASAIPMVGNTTSWVEAREAEVNSFLSTSPGGEDLRFDFRTHGVPFIQNGSDFSGEELLEWLESTLGLAYLAAIRNDNDLVIIVVDELTSSECGKASRSNSLNILNGNVKFFATMQLSPSGCALRPQIIAHELGHLLYADHQLYYNADGTLDFAASEFIDFNSNISSPERYNHAYSNVNDTEYTHRIYNDGNSRKWYENTAPILQWRSVERRESSGS